MSTNGADHEEPAVPPPNIAPDTRTTGVMNNNRNNDNDQASNDRDREDEGDDMIYSNSLMRLLEFFLMLSSVISLFVLVYMHVHVSHMPAACLNHVKSDWPRDGILRVEIIQSYQRVLAEQRGKLDELFSVEKSYEREYKLKQLGTNHEKFLNSFTKINYPKSKEDIDIEPSPKELYGNTYRETDIFFENHIVEYSLKKSFLSLSPNDRSRLGIPVMFVTLEPTRHKCFGDSVEQFFLNHFLGYDKLLMSSVKSLDDIEQKKGYLRNVVTDVHHRLESIKMDRTSYIISFIVMVVFTGSISMLLKYGLHQIHIFTVVLLQLATLDLNGPLSFPVASILVSSLGLIGLVVLMSQYFNDAFIVLNIIIIVWVADEYYTRFCRCSITKYWIKFFYIYHFAFYGYYHRFNGQFGRLALLCSWIFTMHSMCYFLHHYKLQYIMQRAQLQESIQRQQQNQLQHQHQSSGAGGGEDAHQLDTRNPVEVAEADVEFQHNEWADQPGP